MSSIPNLTTLLSNYPGAISEIADKMGCSTDKIYRVLRGAQRKDRANILIACTEYIAEKKAIEETVNEKIMALAD